MTLKCSPQMGFRGARNEAREYRSETKMGLKDLSMTQHMCCFYAQQNPKYFFCRGLSLICEETRRYTNNSGFITLDKIQKLNHLCCHTLAHENSLRCSTLEARKVCAQIGTGMCWILERLLALAPCRDLLWYNDNTFVWVLQPVCDKEVPGCTRNCDTHQLYNQWCSIIAPLTSPKPNRHGAIFKCWTWWTVITTRIFAVGVECQWKIQWYLMIIWEHSSRKHFWVRHASCARF